MVLANLSHAERLDHDALLDGLSKVTTQKGLIYHQKRETSEKCPNILLEREREREREREKKVETTDCLITSLTSLNTFRFCC